jgi:hypothetical protein
LWLVVVVAAATVEAASPVCWVPLVATAAVPELGAVAGLAGLAAEAESWRITALAPAAG